jgi:hypothetical protein
VNVQIARYQPTDQTAWDAFVRASRNGTFLFERGYMDYHADRFDDHSLIARHGDVWIGLLPAHLRDGALISHGGLTFGGWIVSQRLGQMEMLAVFEALSRYARERGIAKLIYKPIPSIYHRMPAEEDLYALFRFGARLADRRPSTVLHGGSDGAPPTFPKERRYEVRKAEKAGVTIAYSEDYAAYWRILEAVLREQHHAKPVHSLAEIEALRRAFPLNIRLYGAFLEGEMIAGALMYISDTVARTQYLASSSRGRRVGALDAVIDYVVRVGCPNKPYFDFGTSIDPESGSINSGLLAYKEDFGGRTIVCDTYILEW